METFLLILKYISGPVIGAVIGFFTNWLAVRMLFRPYTEKRIGRLRLPFTPGIIPKRRGALAASVGRAVSESLLTGDDIAAALITDETESAAADMIVRRISELGGESAEELLGSVLPEGEADKLTARARDLLTDRIYSAACGLDLGSVVAQKGAEAINEKKQSLGFAAMLISDGLVQSLAGKLGDGVNAYIASDGRRLIEEAVDRELSKALASPLPQLGDSGEAIVRAVAGRAFRSVAAGAAEVLKGLDIAAIVERRMNEMDVKELEKLILSVMKRELKAIVWLGGLIGLILGIITVFI